MDRVANMVGEEGEEEDKGRVGGRGLGFDRPRFA